MATTESTELMEPMLPPKGERKLEDLAMDLATKASALASQLGTERPRVQSPAHGCRCPKTRRL